MRSNPRRLLILLLSLWLPLQGLAVALSPRCAHHAGPAASFRHAAAQPAGHAGLDGAMADHGAHRHPVAASPQIDTPPAHHASLAGGTVDRDAHPVIAAHADAHPAHHAQPAGDMPCDHCDPCHAGAGPLVPMPNATAMPPAAFAIAAADARLPQVFIDGPRRPPRPPLA